VFFILLLIYVVTLMPGVPPTDSGELILAAWSGGVAHAPGFPLYTALGWLWSHLLPIGRIVWRLNLLSAACGALAGGLTYALAVITLLGTERTAKAVTTNTIVAAIIGALALGLGRTVWGWATVAEVYTLTLAIAAAILLLVVYGTGLSEPRQSPKIALKAPSRAGPDKKPKGKQPSGQTPTRAEPLAQLKPSTSHLPPAPFRSPWPIIVAAFLFGLGLGAHLTSIALLAPAIAFWLTARRGWRFWISRTALFAALALLAGAAIYLYLPLRAAADPLLNWGRPDTWQRFWWHITAKQYRVSLLSAPVWPQVMFAARLWWTQFMPVGLVLLGIGAWRMFRSQRALFVTLALIILFSTLYAWGYVIEDDGDAYYLTAFLAGAVWVAWGAQAILSLDPLNIRRPVRAAAPFVLVVLTLGASLLLNWGACNRRGDTIPEDYVRDTFAEIGPNGLLLTRDWQLYAPALYLQQIEGARPDLTVVDTELLRRGWYFDLLHKVNPDLMASVAAEEKAFLALRDAWERGDIPDDDPRIAQLQQAYVALIDAFIARTASAGRPVHAGPNRGAEPLRSATLNGQPDMEPGIGTAWQWLPVGLSFRAVAPGAPVTAPAPLVWQIAPFDAVAPTAPERKIRAARADMATLHGLLQANLGNLTAAEADWRLALMIEPGHAAATGLLARLKSGR
jgi:hypothetical protein